jgi:uncharacterized membrane protein (Fun14 family)
MGSFNWSELGKDVGIGGVLGFALGYAAKKAMKFVLISVALLLLLAVALETRGLISINWNGLETAYSQNVKPDAVMSSASAIVERIGALVPSSASFVVGFWLGFKKG